MRALAEFIMRGRMQAIFVVAGAAALPMLFWLSAAAGSLVLLRRGLSDALGVLVWAVLPALAWWYFGDPRTLLLIGARKCIGQHFLQFAGQRRDGHQRYSGKGDRSH